MYMLSPSLPEKVNWFIQMTIVIIGSFHMNVCYCYDNVSLRVFTHDEL